MSTPEPPTDQESVAPGQSKDFRALRDTGDAAGASRSIGMGFVFARDRLARLLLRVGVRPNGVTLAGLVFTCGAGWCLACGGAGQQAPYLLRDVGGPAGWWPLGAVLFLLLSGACDMLDGAVARIGNCGTRAGAMLDSSVDRFSDIALFLGCLLYFALLDKPNLTYQVLAVATMCNALLISYFKARAECLVSSCPVGYWQRGERFAALLIGCSVGHVPAVLWQLGLTGALTVWRRLTYAQRAVHADETGTPPPPAGPSPRWWGRFQLWRHPRGSIAYDVVTGLNIAYIIFAPLIWPGLLAIGPEADPLRTLLGG